MEQSNSRKPGNSSRRDFLKTSTAGLITAAGWGRVPGAYAAGSDTIKAGVIGCGARGTGAASNVLRAAPGVKIVAMCNAFKDRLDTSLTELSQFSDQVDVP